MSYKTLFTFILFLLFIIGVGLVILNALPLLVAASGDVFYLVGMLMVLAFIIFGFSYFWKKIRK